ncbi:hypothetical protein [Methylobacterium brachythecii]|uniref:DUF2946 domain-containing protein n=1 Tax=Methylobacterium brachythecii TaxID=1176177 RepID=A0A7W6AFT6_9HYPH|nr:hypothetical protein [Methylobacterium brachythecii]MBB3901496.1 hypothetical protein [Methylobacterium brachythecii]GLS43068.1 hypothetical protein GCM10007884_10530 [Methylobacterium brachythecii]
MTLVRQIALLLAMVIATIAVSLTPSSAQAHDGRAHAAVTVGSHAAHAVPSHIDRAPTVIQAATAADCDCPSCAAGGNHGSCCFATGLTPTGVAAILPSMASARALGRDRARLDGIVPEALPEPPRSVA